MSTEEQALKAGCARHAGRAAVARCETCTRPLCLSCAVPIRGKVYGPECLADVLGDDGLPAVAPPRGRDVPARWAGFAFTVVALAGTTLPWNRVPGSGPFGAWASSMRWSMLAAVAIAAAALLALVPRVRRGPGHARVGQVALAALCGVAAAGAILHILRPPPFTLPAVGAGVTAGASVVAAGAWAVAARMGSREERTGTG